jgi:hypothetical protein
MRADHDEHNVFPRRLAAGLIVGAIALMPTIVGGVAGTPRASAAEASVNLGTAAPFAVLAGAGVTNTGPSVLGGDLGTCPTPAITGFPPGVVNGTQHANDAVACKAQSDLTIAYNSAAGRAPTTTYPGPTDLGGSTLTTGVYKSPESFAVTGTLTLDAQQNPAAVFIFQTGSSTLVTATNSVIGLINGAQACNVFWQVGTSATVGVGSTFVGTVLALESITGNTSATVEGRLLARNGAVTLDSNKVTAPACATDDSTSGSDDSTSGSDDSTVGSDSTSGPDSTSPATQPASPTDGTPSRNDTTINDATPASRPTTDVRGGAEDQTTPNQRPPMATIPRTGSPIGATLLVAATALVLGAAAIRVSRTSPGPR